MSRKDAGDSSLHLSKDTVGNGLLSTSIGIDLASSSHNVAVFSLAARTEFSRSDDNIFSQSISPLK